MRDELESAYARRCSFYGWAPDFNQLSALEAFGQLFDVLANDKPLWTRFLKSKNPSPKGIYIFGSVGRGKTMLMDLFFSTVPISRKLRLHYDQFMQQVHQLIKKESEQDTGQPIQRVSAYYGKTYKLICLDEFQVNDIADAMILKRLFEGITAHGCGIVTTSNIPPDQLYREGLHYERFEPFVKFLSDSFIIHCLGGDTDYRQQPHFGRRVYFTPHDRRAEQICSAILSRHVSEPLITTQLDVNGRVLNLSAASHHVWTRYTDLCEQPLGAPDYLALANFAKVVYLMEIPIFTTDKLNEARRFITLIDALYDHRVGLVATAEGLPNELNQTGGVQQLPFERTASRLIEMQSETYVEQALRIQK